MERVVLVTEREQLGAEDLAALADPSAREADGSMPQPGSMTLDEMERVMIARALEHYQGNLTRVAEALGLSRPALSRRLEKHGLSGREGGG